MTQCELLLIALLAFSLVGWGITAYAFSLLAVEHRQLAQAHSHLQNQIHAQKEEVT